MKTGAGGGWGDGRRSGREMRVALGQAENKPENVRIAHDFPMSEWMTLFILSLLYPLSPLSLHPSIEHPIPFNFHSHSLFQAYICRFMFVFCV